MYKRQNHDSIDVYTSAGYMLRIDCWKAEKNLKTTYGSECALTSLAVDEPLEYARLYLDGNLQMWVDAIPDTLFFLPAFPFSDYCLKHRKAQFVEYQPEES